MSNVHTAHAVLVSPLILQDTERLAAFRMDGFV